MGLEGLVSKHRESPYRGGRSPRWIKVKNRSHPAFSRVMVAIAHRSEITSQPDMRQTAKIDANGPQQSYLTYGRRRLAVVR